MQPLKNIIVKSTHHNKPIVTDVFYKKTNRKKPVVIFCHGYKGYKDWGAWNLAAKDFAENNIFYVKFNFSHNGGTVENPIDFPDLEAFGKNNFTLELNDLEDVINWVMHYSAFKNEADINDITLIGHSRGGGIVAIKAAENNKVKKLITWAGVSDFGARLPSGEALQLWKTNGISYILNSRTHQKMPHLYQFYQNFIDNEARLTIKNQVSKLEIPHLIIHGTQDAVVSVEEAKNLHSWNPKSELFLIEGMNHPLGCKQPWEKETMPDNLKKVVQKSVQFVLNN